MRRLLWAVVGALVLCHWATIRAQSVAMIAVEDGKFCKAAFGPRDTPPKPPQTIVSCTVSRKDIRDRDGQIVSAVGFYGWTDGAKTRVQVYLLVPAPGAPNRWLKENGDDPKQLRPKAFAIYEISRGQSKRIEEMKALGLDPIIMRFN